MAVCNDGLGRFDCECPGGFKGDLCEIEDETCAADTCSEFGDCVDLAPPATWKCDCDPDYTGKRCDVKIVHCASNPKDPETFIYTSYVSAKTINLSLAGQHP